MGPIRRIVVALGLAGLAAAGIRIGGGKEVAAERGGWTRLKLPTDVSPVPDRLTELDRMPA